MDEQQKQERNQERLEREFESHVSTKARMNPLEWINAHPECMSLRKRINARCWDCMYDPTNGSTLKRIRECPCETICSLWPIRPYQEKK